MSNKVKYKIDKTIWSSGCDSEKQFAGYLIEDLKLVSGEIYLSGRSFKVKGKTKGNIVIEIIQTGEFDMYGGPYDPKMNAPKVIYDGNDITGLVINAINEADEENSATPDVSRTGFWCHILSKLEVLTHLKDGDELRGTASITDTGLFDFMNK
jgi:hypothetical protein